MRRDAGMIVLIWGLRQYPSGCGTLARRANRLLVPRSLRSNAAKNSVGWAKAQRAVPTISPRCCVNGGHAEPVIGRAFARPGGFAHPHMGPCESRLSNGSGLDFRGERAARGAVRSAARRPGPERGLASENCSRSLHHLISGRTLDPYPHSACLRRGSHEDETHLRTGLVWPLGGTVIIHPTGERGLRRGAPAQVRFYAFMVAPSGTSPAVR